DLEVNRVADADAVTEAVVHDLDRSPLHPEHLADERGQPFHRAALLPTEDRRELLHLFVRRALVDEHAEAPVAVGHDLRRIRDRGDLETAHVRALDLALADVSQPPPSAHLGACSPPRGRTWSWRSGCSRSRIRGRARSAPSNASATCSRRSRSRTRSVSTSSAWAS